MCWSSLRVFVFSFVSATLLLSLPSSARAQQPSADYNSLLRSVGLYALGPNYNVLRFEYPFNVVFVQPSQAIDVVLTKAGSTTPLWENAGRANPLVDETVFFQFAPSGAAQYRIEDEGDYEFNVRVDKKPVTRLPFRVSFRKSGDAFNPQMLGLLDGPWNNLAFLHMPQKDTSPSIGCWMRSIGFNQSNAKVITVKVFREGEQVAENGGSSTVAAPKWHFLRFELKFPSDRGSQGGAFKKADLLKQDGLYSAVVYEDGEVHHVFDFKVEGGEVPPHARQESGYEPHVDYLVPRIPYDSFGSTGDVVWLEKASEEEAGAALAVEAREAEPLSAAERSRWLIRSSVDTGRPLEIVVTENKVRGDAMIQAGDGFVAYGTGSRQGVAYLRVGDATEQSIPDGTTYSSKVFWACGKKLVLMKDQQLFIFDSASGQTAPVPKEDVFLYSRVGYGLYAPNPMQVGGYLVAVICDQSKVKDRRAVKVIDISGSEPRVYSIKTPGLADREIACVAVDPLSAKVGMTSKAKQALYIADVAPGAIARPIDLSGQDSVSADGMLHAGDGYFAYSDAAGFSKLRFVEVTTGKVLNAGRVMSAGYALRGRQYAFSKSAANRNTFYAIGIAPQGAAHPANSGQSISEARGVFGQGGSAAITPSGVVILAGAATPKPLQASRGAYWTLLTGSDGKAVLASDVVLGEYVAAFKAGTRDDPSIGYATFGKTIDLPAPQVSGTPVPASATASSSGNATGTSESGEAEMVAPKPEDIAAQVQEEAERVQEEIADAAAGAAKTGFLLLLHWLSRLVTVAILLASGLMLASAAVTEKVPALKGLVGALQPHAGKIGLVAIAVVAVDFILDLLILRPVLGDGVPQAVGLAAGLVLANTIIAKSSAHGVAGKAKAMAEKHKDKIAKLEGKAQTVGFACLIVAAVHLVMGWLPLV